MPIVNYVREHMRFIEYASDEGLSSGERLVWYALMHIINGRAQGSIWPEGFIRIANDRLLALCPMQLGAVIMARNSLKQRGLIDFIPGSRNKRAPAYKINFFSPEFPPDSPGKAEKMQSYCENRSNYNNNMGSNYDNNIGGNNGNIVPNYTEREYQTGKTGYPEEEDEEYTEAERACTGGRARDKQIAAIWRSDFGALPAPAQVQRLSTAADVLQMPLTVLREAVRCAAATGAKSPMAYVLTLLQDWHYAGVRTADEVGEYAYLRDVVEGRQPGDREKAQQGLAQMRRRHQQMPDGSEEGADG